MAIAKYCHRCGCIQPKGHKHRPPDTRPNSSRRGYDARWRRTRAAHLRAYPICQHPEGCIAPATDVHHLDGQGPLGERGHDPSNLQALCGPHHARITAQEQPGGWNLRGGG